MIFPDVNVLIHAYNSESSLHQKARVWWESRLAGPAGVALAWVVVLGFVRIMTNRRIMENPFPPKEILEIVQEWMHLPHFSVVHPGENHFTFLSKLLENLGTAGNLTTDAHLAALAIERGLILHSTDADFSRFPELRWKNPLIP
jgi:uncharacterized protein